MKSSHFVLPGFLSVLLCACGDDGMQPKAPEKIGAADLVVYESDGSVQCSPPTLTPQQSAQKLVNGGIDVMQSGCGGTTGVAYAAVCGGLNGSLLLHEIRRVNLPDAERLGFNDASKLIDQSEGTGYAWVDCTTREPIH